MKRTLKIVQTLRDEGAQGTGQIAQRLEITSKIAAQALRQMAECGSIKKTVINEDIYWYVDDQCTIPQGATHRQVMEMWD